MATFSSGNRMLDAVWRLNAHSCLYCSQEQFIDTPTREKGQFVWDAANSSEGVMRAYGEQNLTWQALRDVVRGQARYWTDGRINAVYPNDDGARDIPTFTARYPEWLWRYYLSTGDRATVVGHYTSVTKVADWLWARRGSNGLLYGLAFGSNGDPVYGYDLSVTADTTGNALSVNAFRRVGQVAGLAGDQGGAALWSARADQLAAAMNAALRRPDGTYVDGLEANGAPSTHASQEANALALAYGVVPAADVASVGRYVAGMGISVGPIHGLELLRALAAADMPEAVVHTLTDASMPGWARIVAAGGTFTWETWVPSDLIGDSMSHGWASSALAAMQESLLGVTFIDPNLEGTVHVAVTPPRGGLSRASGSVPTVAGPVVVSWQRRGAGMALDVTVPVNVSALVHLPYSQAASVREGGVSVRHAPGVVPYSVSGGTAVLSIGSGSYRFTSA
jgi:alpha-L-rhamnosidase